MLLSFDNVGSDRETNAQIEINGQKYPIIPDDCGISPSWQGFEYLYYDGEGNIYLSMEYHGDTDYDDCLAIYSLSSNGGYLEYTEAIENYDIPYFDLMDILDNV